MASAPSIRVWFALALVVSASAAGAPSAQLDRDDDPLVLTGAGLPSFLGIAPDRLVAFRFVEGWVQVPIQVDERAVVDFGTIQNRPPSGLTLLTYTDAGTFTGPDPDPVLDADDEIVVMARDAGPRKGAGETPAGTIAGSGRELVLEDPLTGDSAWLYLFESDGSLDPSAGEERAPYDFVLLSGDYKTTYKLAEGFNPEASRVETGAYDVGFSDRWFRDLTAVRLGTAGGVDLLDVHKIRFGPGICTRTEETASFGQGAFIVNKSGAVRSLRGYVGANSGKTTYRIHRFYETREEIETVLRVHAIPGVMDFFDYADAALQGRYRNDLNPAGVTVDGQADAVDAGALAWEMYSGDVGTLAMTTLVDTDIAGLAQTSYYNDDDDSPIEQCTGDAHEYGASGFWVPEAIPNTDPESPTYNRFVTDRIIRYAPPNQPLGFAVESDRRARNPVTATVAARIDCVDGDGDGFVDCVDGCWPTAGQSCGDCDDGDPARNPNAAESCDGIDNDCDGGSPDGGDEAWFGQSCDGADPDACEEGSLGCETGLQVCSDDSGESFEICGNGLDDDCDGLTDTADPDCALPDCPDGDGDGFVVCDEGCSVPNGKACGDCDDGDPARYPNAAEGCDGIDNDCDAATADGDDEPWLGQSCDGADPDACEEGSLACSSGTQTCTDETGESFEICGNGLDDDCDGLTDGEDPDCALPDCPDADADGFVVCDASCSVPAAKSCGDCDDGDPARNPNAAESCDGIDNDCDAATADGDDEPWLGQSCDGDDPDTCEEGSFVCDAGLRTCTDDTGESFEICGNGLDDDCDGLTDTADPDCPLPDCPDGDADGFVACDASCSVPAGKSCGDCDDADPARNPNAAESCDGIDNDCDAATADGDDEPWLGQSCDGDDPDTCEEGSFVCDAGLQACTDDSGESFEICGNGLDDDCDGLTDTDDPDCALPDCADGDGDDFVVCDGSCSVPAGKGCGDCDDTHAGINPAAAEVCDNNEDDDCNGLFDLDDPACEAEACPDADGDGFADCSLSGCSTLGSCGDCDDGNGDHFPGAGELCDGIDNDCDGMPDNAECPDFDVDGDLVVDGIELSWLGRAFGLCSLDPDAEWWGPVDYNGDGCIDGEDLSRLASIAWGCTGLEQLCD